MKITLNISKANYEGYKRYLDSLGIIGSGKNGSLTKNDVIINLQGELESNIFQSKALEYFIK